MLLRAGPQAYTSPSTTCQLQAQQQLQPHKDNLVPSSSSLTMLC